MTIRTGKPRGRDLGFMELALAQARLAAERGEVPVGAVVVKDDRIIGKGANARERLGDPTAHAEIVALREAARRLNTWRLDGTELFVTVEPCPMCAGAMVFSRVERLVFGATQPRWGAAGTLYDIVRDDRLNHRLEVTAGVLDEEASRLLRTFFRTVRSGQTTVL